MFGIMRVRQMVDLRQQRSEIAAVTDEARSPTIRPKPMP